MEIYIIVIYSLGITKNVINSEKTLFVALLKDEIFYADDNALPPPPPTLETSSDHKFAAPPPPPISPYKVHVDSILQQYMKMAGSVVGWEGEYIHKNMFKGNQHEISLLRTITKKLMEHTITGKTTEKTLQIIRKHANQSREETVLLCRYVL
jgi:hypothetical protein